MPIPYTEVSKTTPIFTLRLAPRPWPGLSLSLPAGGQGFRPTGVLEGATGLPVGLHNAIDVMRKIIDGNFSR